jgi:hypothetical protein
MTDLSPAAQTVLDAFNREARPEPHHQQEAIAAALRAAADQVVPETPKPSGNSNWDLHHWTLVLDSYYQRKNTRVQILAIATELKGQP